MNVKLLLKMYKLKLTEEETLMVQYIIASKNLDSAKQNMKTLGYNLDLSGENTTKLLDSIDSKLSEIN